MDYYIVCAPRYNLYYLTNGYFDEETGNYCIKFFKSLEFAQQRFATSGYSDALRMRIPPAEMVIKKARICLRGIS